MANILLIEPNYKCKQPPLGLMKISFFHKNILHDYVRFTKGKLPDALSSTKWDRVYVTSLFTFEWKETLKAVEYAKTLVDSWDKIVIGGIAATILPEQIHEATGIRPVCGLLNEPGKLGLPGDECIDQITPDYSMLEDIDYVYPFNDAYFLSATKGCGNKCGFCAVQTLEPTFIPYIDIKDRVRAIDERFGPKKDLILMDNNVLRSPRFNDIIDDIIAAGFGKGATYRNPRTGKTVQRYVDFNQGLDALFLTEEKAKRLGEIALKPARIAFDHIEDREIYERAMRLCAKNGITELSNYILYNSEDFGGKGKKYHADTPADLYNRMKITLDLLEELNAEYGAEQRIAAFSFPMRYIPLSAHERGYVGSQWNAKFLRAVQTMLIPTQGKGVCRRSFFEADFGKNADEFVRYLSMPEKLIAARGKISTTARGRASETPEQFALRKADWERNQKKIRLWNALYDQLGEEREDFVRRIGDNKYLPEKVLGIPSATQRKLYILYLTTPRLIALLGMIDKNSPTYATTKAFLVTECPELYLDILDLVSGSEAQQSYIFRNFAAFFGRDGISDLLKRLVKSDFDADKQLTKWDSISKKEGIGYIDFELIRVYRRFVELAVLSEEDHHAAQKSILEVSMTELASILYAYMDQFESALLSVFDTERGQAVLKKSAKAITNHIQCKLENFLGEKQ
ncbi:MAG: hypothetical protein LUI10_13235 [Lachnospiraceae bacterium]|nr:hypothetical protein [Lachnospiraceae bacterium]